MKILVFDIGGTAIKYGICTNGHLEETKEYPTEAFRGGTHILNTICRLSEQYLPFDAIGISTAGQVNPDEGSIIYANSNIPDYTGTQFKRILQKLFHVPVAVENDVNSAALGEAVFGAGKGKNSFLCLTYGTGVGGAIIENKQVYHGSSFSAGEFGAIITHAEEKLSGTDPFDGCYERYASATALVKMVSTVDSSLTNGRQIFASLKRPEINEVINKWIDEIVLGLATLIHIFNPSCIVLGGGIMVQPYILERIHTRIPQMVMSSFTHVQISNAKLGNSAGLWEPITLLRRNFDFPNMKRASKAEILYLWQSCLIIHLRQSSRVQKTRNVCRSISPLCRTVLIVLFCGIVIIALLWRFHIILI